MDVHGGQRPAQQLHAVHGKLCQIVPDGDGQAQKGNEGNPGLRLLKIVEFRAEHHVVRVAVQHDVVVGVQAQDPPYCFGKKLLPPEDVPADPRRVKDMGRREHRTVVFPGAGEHVKIRAHRLPGDLADGPECLLRGDFRVL